MTRLSGQSRVRIPAEATDLSLPPFDQAGSVWGPHILLLNVCRGFLAGVKTVGT